jgi:DNA-binding NtrC family response regulator
MSDGRDPSTIAQASGLRAKATCFELRVTGGPDAGRSVSVSARSPGRVLVGTGEACHLRLTDRRTSRRHLALEASDDGLRVVDLGSTNGTRIGGLRIVEAVCQGGEVVGIGDSTLRVDVDRIESEAPDVRMAFGPMLGASLAMRRLYRTCDTLAAATTGLLVEGEPGTGKSLLAEALHLAGPSKDGPFVVVEGAVLGEVMGSTEKTDALAAEAAGGTLLIREVSDAPLEAQPALARFIHAAHSRRIRVVASTTKNLDAAVEARSFAEELAHELSTRIELPPLRERRGDIALLVESFCRDLGAAARPIATKKLAALNRQPFPGNVRELKAAVAHLLADAGASITAATASAGPGAADDPEAPTPESLGLETTYRDLLILDLPFADAKQRLVDRFASAYVTFSVASRGGHVARAAAASGLAPRYFNLLRARSRGRGPSGEDA